MEHPTGEFDSAVAAMEDAIRRLRALQKCEQWITFSAQAEGPGTDICQFAEIRLLRDKLDVGEKPLDVSRVIQTAHIIRLLPLRREKWHRFPTRFFGIINERKNMDLFYRRAGSWTAVDADGRRVYLCPSFKAEQP